MSQWRFPGAQSCSALRQFSANIQIRPSALRAVPSRAERARERKVRCGTSFSLLRRHRLRFSQWATENYIRSRGGNGSRHVSLLHILTNKTGSQPIIGQRLVSIEPRSLRRRRGEKKIALSQCNFQTPDVLLMCGGARGMECFCF